MTVAIAALALTLATRGDSGADLASDADLASVADESSSTERNATATPVPTSTPTPNPLAVSAPDDSLTISRLWSPAPNTARAEGAISSGELQVAVTSDGRDLAPITIRADSDGSFVVDITGLDAGPQSVCLADACQRVLVSDPAVEEIDVLEARINDALTLVDDQLDLDELTPDWTYLIGGPNSSSGGFADAVARTITINANSGRTADDYRVTVLHEVAHAVDAEWLTPDDRDRFRELRGHDADLPWGSVDPLAVGDARWLNSAEDFAEVFVAWALNNDYSIMSEAVAPQPSDDDLRQFCAVIAAAPLECN